ncbi:MAG: hypothetical protein K940chlam1_01064 [Candidatus Anoxychlamydiales bacterium]|nr:hypothetical protein [Candidatus Anoxychlamydiales bacterium]NGX36343.1 hypothetical protein [Candidatus Anoxychlamydiales bacterium]
MKDKYKELSLNLDNIINSLKEFKETKNDFKKPDIRAYQVQMLNLGKVIGSPVLKHVTNLNDDIDEYLSEPLDKKYLNLIGDATRLKNDLWEL